MYYYYVTLVCVTLAQNALELELNTNRMLLMNETLHCQNEYTTHLSSRPPF